VTLALDDKNSDLWGGLMSDLNDPRVFFAAERTLLAWSRTSLTLMAFGFVVERFGLFVQLLRSMQGQALQREPSFWVGVSFILFGSLMGVVSVLQYRLVLRTLKPVEIPEGYWVNTGVYANLALAVFGIAITIYFFYGLH
jgi:putative membrane protein